MLLSDIKSQLVAAMKAGDSVRVDTLRFLIAAVRNMAIAKYGAAGEEAVKDDDVLETIKKQVKTHKESVDAFTKAGRPELAKKEQDELAVLSAFLPMEMTDEELSALLADVAASGEQNFGLLMKAAMAKVAGRADGSRVSAILRNLAQAKS